MVKDMDNMCGIIAIVLIVLIFMNFQKEYKIVHRQAGSACSMASDEVSAKASLSIEPEGKSTEDTFELDVGVLNKDVWSGEKKELTDEEKETQTFLDDYITTIHEEKFDEHMKSGCNANMTKPTYQKIIEAGAANRSVSVSKPTFSKNIGRTGFHEEARKFYAPESSGCLKPSYELYFNGNEAHYEAQKCK